MIPIEWHDRDGIEGVWGQSPPEAMTSNAKKDQRNTSDPPPPKYLMKYMTHPTPRSFYFQPPQYITKKISDPSPPWI